VKIRWTVLGLAIATAIVLSATGLAPAVSKSVRKPPPPCGVAAPKKSNGTAWKCSFYDNFTGKTLDRKKWKPVLTSKTGYRNGPSCYLDRRDLTWQSKGTLLLAVRTAKPFGCKAGTKKSFDANAMAGSISTMETFTQTYGLFQVRAAFPSTHVAGLQSAIWMFPRDSVLALANYPEMDIAEFFTSVPDRVIPVLHYPMLVPTGQNWTNNTDCLVTHPEKYHTYWISWSSKLISIGVDKKACLLNDNWTPAPPMFHPAPFDKPFALILTQALGVRGNKPRTNTPFPAFMKVDWVRIWR
jgi:beta-glucanase (GH16 family)